MHRKVALAFGHPAGKETLAHEYPLHWLADNSGTYHRGRDSVSRSTLMRYLPDFEATGAIRIERRRDESKRIQTSRYVIDTGKIAAAKPVSEPAASLPAWVDDDEAAALSDAPSKEHCNVCGTRSHDLLACARSRDVGSPHCAACDYHSAHFYAGN
jgi:hypothetical protein